MFKYVHMKNKYQMKYGEMQSAVIFVLKEVRLENVSENLQIRVLSVASPSDANQCQQ